MGHVKNFLGGDAMTIGREGPSQINISWAAAIAAFPIVLGLITLISWALTNAIQANNTSIKVVELRLDMVEGFKTLKEQVAGLPTQAAQIKQIDERARDLVISLGKFGEKLTETDRVAYDAAQGMKRLEFRMDKVEDEIHKRVPLRDTK